MISGENILFFCKGSNKNQKKKIFILKMITMTIFSDGELLHKTEKSIDFENQELGLKPNYSIGDNNCNGMDTTAKPNIPLLK